MLSYETYDLFVVILEEIFVMILVDLFLLQVLDSVVSGFLTLIKFYLNLVVLYFILYRPFQFKSGSSF